MQKFFLSLCILLFSNVLLADSPFFSFKEVNSYLTKNAENSIGLSFDKESLEYLKNKNNIEFFIELPTLDKKFIKTSLKRFSVISEDHNLLIQNDENKFKEDFESGISSFKINYQGKNIGVLLVLDNKVIASYKLNRRQLELNYFNFDYVLFDVNDIIKEKTFSCAVEQELEQILVPENNSSNSSMTPLCLELAIEVDQFTRNTFSSNTNAADWAHAIIAGVSQVYYSEVGINISVSNTIIWNSQDPYANITNDAGTMLDALRTQWTSNNSSISRDLVHLLTKRGNTGTGGIAYLDVLCDNSWGYAFSSVLDNDTSFCSCPTYTWNLFVCSHEIGHNIGANHTHWCGWVPEPWNGFIGGPIDNCVDVQGSCSNNPAPEVGTIMSYCHTTSSGALIDFHDIVISQALNPGINSGSCLTICSFYGCTDSNATNYDPSATVDDSSCVYPNILLSSNISMPACFGESSGSIDLVVNGGQAPYLFLWNNGATTEDIFLLSSDTFSVTVTDAQGWVASNSFYVSQPDSFYTIINTLNASDSSSSDGAIFINVVGGSYPYTYYWNDGTNFFPDTTPYLLNLSFGTYNLFVVDDNTCFQSISIDIGVDFVYSGCTDPNASNYDPNATIDDGSCLYMNCSSPVPSGLFVNWTTDTKASVSWDNMNDSACMVFKYFIRYRVDNLDGTYGSWVTKSAGVGNGLCNFGLNTTEKRLQFLTSATTYQFKMKAFYCGGTESGYSSPVSFNTGADCPPMTNLAVQTFNSNQAKATFSWDTTGAYVFARIALRVDTTGASWGTAGGFGVYYPSLSVNKFGLTPGQSYRAQGRTFCDSNVTSFRSTWTSPLMWTQPGTLIRMESTSQIKNLDIYPNPSRDIFNIRFISEKIQDLSVRVINIMGELVYQEKVNQFIGEYTKQIDLTDNSKGVYFLEITTDNNVVNRKIIIQ